MNYYLIFLTGLTSGGVTCAALQGGILAGIIANGKTRAGNDKKGLGFDDWGPVSAFLLTKLISHVILGFLLGWLGSRVDLSLSARLFFQGFAAVFMLAIALNLLDVHPIFRYLAIQPPKFVYKWLKKTENLSADRHDLSSLFAPAVFGVLTIFIPCGVTQAMMATALGTGSVLMGAALMFAFTLGTSPVFFIVAYLATELGSKLEKFFMRFVAVVVLLLGLFTFDSGLNLMGSPFSLQNLTRSWFSSPAQANTSVDVPQPVTAAEGEIVLSVGNNGYSPALLKAPAGKDLVLNLVTNKTYSCARDFVIPDLNYYELLPDTGTVQVSIPAQAAGTKLFFTCSMGMYTGQIIFE